MHALPYYVVYCCIILLYSKLSAMLRKLWFSRSKSHSSKGDSSNQVSGSTDTGIVELHSTSKAVQTGTVEVHVMAVQTELGDHETVEHNLLTPLPNSLMISIPLQYYLSVKLESVSQLSKCMRSMKCIKNWFVLSCDLEPSVCDVKLVKVCEKIVITLEVTTSMQWFVLFPSLCIECTDTKFNGLPSVITSITDLQVILIYLNQNRLCVGIADPQFVPVTSKCKGVFTNKLGRYTILCMFDYGCKIFVQVKWLLTLITSSWLYATAFCEWLLSNSSVDICSACRYMFSCYICLACSNFRKGYLYSKLKSTANHTESQEAAAVAVSSHVN